MQRRQLLARATILPLAWGHARLFAAAPGTPRLLLVFMRGGYDAASLLVPISSPFYYEARPDIALAKPSTDLASALPLTADWGLHPALRESLYPLYQSGELAFVPFAGTTTSRVATSRPKTASSWASHWTATAITAPAS